MFANQVHYVGEGKFYEFTAMTGLIVGILLILGHMIKIIPNNGIVWLIILVFDMVFAFFNLIAASIVIKYVRFYKEIAAVVTFGYIACFTYVIDGFFLLLKIRGGRVGPVGSSQPDGNEQAWTTQTPLPKY